MTFDQEFDKKESGTSGTVMSQKASDSDIYDDNVLKEPSPLKDLIRNEDDFIDSTDISESVKKLVEGSKEQNQMKDLISLVDNVAIPDKEIDVKKETHMKNLMSFGVKDLNSESSESHSASRGKNLMFSDDTDYEFEVQSNVNDLMTFSDSDDSLVNKLVTGVISRQLVGLQSEFMKSNIDVAGRDCSTPIVPASNLNDIIKEFDGSSVDPILPPQTLSQSPEPKQSSTELKMIEKLSDDEKGSLFIKSKCSFEKIENNHSESCDKKLVQPTVEIKPTDKIINVHPDIKMDPTTGDIYRVNDGICTDASDEFPENPVSDIKTVESDLLDKNSKLISSTDEKLNELSFCLNLDENEFFSSTDFFPVDSGFPKKKLDHESSLVSNLSQGYERMEITSLPSSSEVNPIVTTNMLVEIEETSELDLATNFDSESNILLPSSEIQTTDDSYLKSTKDISEAISDLHMSTDSSNKTCSFGESTSGTSSHRDYNTLSDVSLFEDNRLLEDDKLFTQCDYFQQSSDLISEDLNVKDSVNPSNLDLLTSKSSDAGVELGKEPCYSENRLQTASGETASEENMPTEDELYDLPDLEWKLAPGFDAKLSHGRNPQDEDSQLLSIDAIEDQPPPLINMIELEDGPPPLIYMKNV